MPDIIRPKLIAYTTNTANPPKEFANYRVTFSHPTFFAVVPPKGKYEYFYVDNIRAEEIRATFKLSDPSVKEFSAEETPIAKSKAIETEVQKEIEKVELKEVVEPIDEETIVEGLTAVDENGDEQIIPDDLSTLKWPELKSLAAKFTDKKSFKKDEAIEILTKVKGK